MLVAEPALSAVTKTHSRRQLADDFLLRRACPADLDVLSELESLSYSEESRGGRAVLQERLARFAHGIFLLIEKSTGACIGYLSSEIWAFNRTAPEEFFRPGRPVAQALDTNGTELYVSSLAIHPNYRAKKLSYFLFCGAVDALRREFPKLRSVILMISQSWTAARRMFTRQRYIAVDQFPNFFRQCGRQKPNAIIMRKYFGTA